MSENIFDARKLRRLMFLSGILGIAAGITAVLFQYMVEYGIQFCFNRLVGISQDGPVYRETAKSFTPWLIIFKNFKGLVF